MANFSIYAPPISNTKPLKDVSAFDVYKVITSHKYKELTETFRAIENESEYKKYKVSKFHCATFSGTFTNRDSKDLVKHSGLICVDIDKITPEKITELKPKILEGFTPVLMFVSPSGNGLKIVYQIDIESSTHLNYFEALQGYFSSVHSVDIDKACKDVSRACFLPYDSEAFYSDSPTLLDQSFIDTFQKIEPPKPKPTNQAANASQSKSVIDTACRMIEQAPDGEKHNTLLKAAHLCGGAIAAGLINESEAISELEAAISFRNIDSFSEAQKTIKKGIEKGKEKPIDPVFENNSLSQPQPPKIKTPPLPIEGLPIEAQKIINECSEVMGTPRDLWAQSFIAASALAIGTSVELQTKYSNNPVFWFISVANSGVGKTEPDSFFFAPFHKRDSEALKLYNEQKSEFERIKAMSKSERESEGITETPPPPFFSQYLLNDTTPEALILANKNNPSGICIQRDEFAGFINDFGRYAKSGEQQNWLSSWSQSTMTINRKGGDPLKISRPFINISGGLQPSILPDLAKENRDSNGFLQRICFAFPDVCERPQYTAQQISNDVKRGYIEYIDRLLMLRQQTDPTILTLSNEASDIYRDFYNKNTKLSNETPSDYLKAMFAKLDYISLRLAIVVHCCKWAMTGDTREQVSPETMEAAIQITEYYRATGMKVYNILKSGATTELDKKSVIKYLSSLGTSQNKIAAALNIEQPYISKILKNSRL